MAKAEKTPAIGDNVAKHRISEAINQIENLNAEIKELQDDRTELLKTLRGDGYDTKILREIVKLRKLSREDRIERRGLLDVYGNAAGLEPEEV